MAQPESERKRALEVSKYYSVAEFTPHQSSDGRTFPANACETDTNPAFVVVPDQNGPAPARVSPDPALTAFAQLGVHRLHCERAFISLIDHRTQHIIAEATKTVSLVTEERHGVGDALYLGRTALPITFGVCPNTIQTFTDANHAITTSNIVGNASRYIIHDFKKEPTYVDRPYVTGFPHMRFYAEVPLKSSHGHVIGSYCVVDNKPRDRFSDEEVGVLSEIAAAIATHLELFRMKQDHNRAQRLMSGLGTFIEDGPTPETNRSPTSRAVTNAQPHLQIDANADHDLMTDSIWKRPPMSRTYSSGSEPSGKPRLSSAGGSVTGESQSTIATSMLPNNRAMEALSKEERRLQESRGDGATELQDPESELKPNYNTTGAMLQQSIVSTSIRDTFSRAAHIIQDCMELEGLVFFDACLSSFGSRTDRPSMRLKSRNTVNLEPSPEEQSSELTSEDERARRQAEPEFPTNAQEENSNPFDGTPSFTHNRRPSSQTSQKMCDRLGESTMEQNNATSITLESRHSSLPENSLRKLLKRYSYGHIFKFDEAGPVTSSDEDTPRAHQASSRSDKSRSKRSRGKWRSRGKRAEGALLASLFPGVRSLIFLPLWDSHKGRWYAAACGWTTNPRRALQPEELTYIAAFGNSIMAEVARLEAVATDRVKSDFISSISHELRSPLHGILASAELLQDLSIGTDQDELVKMVDSCGRTLLDVMNHLLDHAKINQFVKSAKRTGGQAYTLTEDSQPGLAEPLDLSKLVEEVVEGIYNGHRYNTGRTRVTFSPAKGTPEPHSASVGKLSVILDTEKRSSWVFNTPPGAWKRIVMNLFGNALKYCEAGFIRVALRSKNMSSIATGPRQAVIELRVSDTGRGISTEYLKHRLYVPFAQENSLSAGTGLGLSIVQNIVTVLGGNVDVQSEHGTGTEIKVLIPLEPVHDNKLDLESKAQDDTISKVRNDSRGLTLCFISFDVYPDIDEVPTGVLSVNAKRVMALKSALLHFVKDWFEMEIIFANSFDNASADIFVAEQSYLQALEKNGHDYEDVLASLNGSPMILLNSETQPVRLNGGFGLHKMARAVANALEYRSSVKEGTSEAGLTHAQENPDTFSPKASTPLPSRPLQAKRSFSAPSVNNPATSSNSVHVPKVLVVDDNEINLKILVTFMHKLGYNYGTATDGLQALEKYKAAAAKEKFEFVLMDISMPVMDGLVSTREIRAFERMNSVKTPSTIIALTGLASAKAQQEAFASGVNLFLTKPILLKTLRSLLGGTGDSAIDGGG